jgi:hypothetical protein
MSRWFLALSLLVAACSWEHKVNRLSDAEFQHYYALKPFMADEERKEYLLLKTAEERDAWLKSHHAEGAYDRAAVMYWDMFYNYPEPLRQKIVDGAVAVGWKKEMVLMAWGAPYDKRRLTGRPASRSEMLVYRFEQQEDGAVLVYIPGSKTAYRSIRNFTREVYVDDDKVTEIIEKDGWPG